MTSAGLTSGLGMDSWGSIPRESLSAGENRAVDDCGAVPLSSLGVPDPEQEMGKSNLM